MAQLILAMLPSRSERNEASVGGITATWRLTAMNPFTGREKVSARPGAQRVGTLGCRPVARDDLPGLDDDRRRGAERAALRRAASKSTFGGVATTRRTDGRRRT